MKARASRLASRLLPLAALAIVLAAIPCPAAGQSQTLFFDDFEHGNLGWFWDSGLWHFANPGSCGSSSHAIAYSKPATCNYDTNGPNSGTLFAPSVIFSGQGPFTLSFDYTLSLDAGGGDTCSVFVYGQGWDIEMADNLSLDASGTPHTISLSFPDIVTQSEPSLIFKFQSDGVGDGSAGWTIDNVKVTNSGATWKSFGDGKAGVAGVPVLEGEGNLTAMAFLFDSLNLSSAAPNAASMLFIGLGIGNLPFKGGVLIPVPQLMLPLTTNVSGKVSLFFAMPPSVPPGTAIFFQAWVADAAASHGLSASNGLLGVSN